MNESYRDGIRVYEGPMVTSSRTHIRHLPFQNFVQSKEIRQQQQQKKTETEDPQSGQRSTV